MNEKRVFRSFSNKRKRSWLQRAIAPEVLFTASLAEVLIVYAFWISGRENPAYTFVYSIKALIIWCIGYAAFLFGGLLARIFCPSHPVRDPFRFRSDAGVNIWTALLMVQAILAIQAYGGIPILQYLSGIAVVDDAQAAQQGAAFGQFGLLAASCNVCILFVVISALREAPRRISIPRVVGNVGTVLFAIALTMLAGKRQGAFQAVVTLGSTIIVSGAPFGGGLQRVFLGGRKSKMAYLGAGAVVIALFVAMATFENIRSASVVHRRLGDAELTYMELTQMNFDYQTQIAGWGPQDNVGTAGVFITLMPRRLWDMLSDPMAAPAVLEPTAPSGFWSALHWYLGVWGVIGGGLLFGGISRFIYDRAFSSAYYGAAYAFVPWCLLTGIAYNHFLNLPFFLLPIVLVFSTMKMMQVFSVKNA